MEWRGQRLECLGNRGGFRAVANSCSGVVRVDPVSYSGTS